MKNLIIPSFSIRHIKIKEKNVRLLNQTLSEIDSLGITYQKEKRKRNNIILITESDLEKMGSEKFKQLSKILYNSTSSYKVKMNLDR